MRWLLDDAGITAADVDIVAYNFDGFGDAAVLVVDSLGETCTTSIAAASRAGDQVGTGSPRRSATRPRSATPTAR